MPSMVAGIHVLACSRRLLTRTWPVPKTSPAITPPARAAAGLSMRPTARVPIQPASGRTANPAVHRSQPRRKAGREAVVLFMPIKSFVR